ncbi:MAG: hypothetical protein NC238_10310 [Dehalobacter sp.]|nr:hypothetical protein [Dehalobacter sp.]
MTPEQRLNQISSILSLGVMRIVQAKAAEEAIFAQGEKSDGKTSGSSLELTKDCLTNRNKRRVTKTDTKSAKKSHSTVNIIIGI